MDIHYENEFEKNFSPDSFLDYTNCDPDERNKIIDLLKPNPSNERLELPWGKREINVYNDHPKPDQAEEMPKMWSSYEIEGNLIKYEAPANTSPVLVTMPSTVAYGQSLVTPVYNEWQNVYINSITSDPNNHPFMQGIAYPQHIYPVNNDNMEIPIMRENGRRGRARGNKNYGRNMNNTNEMQPNYINDHGQYPMQYSYAYYPESNIAPPQHPAVGPPIYFPSHHMYSPMTHQPHRVEYPAYQAPTNVKFSRQSQNLLQSQMNGDVIKNTSHGRPYEKRMQNIQNMQSIQNMPSMQNMHNMQSMQNTQNIQNLQNVNMHKPSIHPMVDVTSTVIVNNSNLEPPLTINEENPTANNSNFNNKKFDLKIEHYVSTTKEECKGIIEKNDIPFVNIKSSIEVKQNGNVSKEHEEITSNTSTPITTSNKPDVVIVEEEISKIEVKDEPVTVENVTEVNEIPQSSSTPATTWANILKKPNTLDTNVEGITKPTAIIEPNNVLNTNNEKIEHDEKIQMAPKSYQNKTSVEDASRIDISSKQQKKPLHSEVPQRHCDDPVTYRMGEFLLSYQMDKQTVSLLPRGLTNRSNYCYINSILQALLACPPFYNLLKALPHSKNPSKHSPSPLIDNMIKFVNEFSPLADGARLARKDRAHKRNEDAVVEVQSGVPFEPSYIYGILKNTSSPGVFSVEGRQEDAEEFLSCLLNGISDEMLELMKLANSNHQKVIECIENVDYNQDEEWEVKGRGKKSSITRSTDFGRTPLSEIFRGQLRSRVSRATEVSTDYVQPFFTLQLDIEKAESVKSALETLVRKDQLEGMTCSKTKQQIEAWKQVTLEELPVILILHLKWFDYSSDGCTKICKRVEFPIDLKIDNKLMSANAKSKSQKQRQYKLFAVTYHDGKEATKGHYVTDAFHVGYGGWVRYDDSSLKGVSEANVLNPQPPRAPYLLYYRRCDTIGNNQSNNVKTR